MKWDMITSTERVCVCVYETEGYMIEKVCEKDRDVQNK